MKTIDLEQHPIYLGCIEEEGNFQKIILCTELPSSQYLNLENFNVYPKIDYKVERGIIHYTNITIIKMIDLSYLLKLLKCPTIDELKKQLTTTMIEKLMKQDNEKNDSYSLNYLKRIYSLLQLNELEQQEIKLSSNIKKYSYKKM